MAVTRIWDQDNAVWQPVGHGSLGVASFGPIGEISAWGTNTAPENHLLLDGSNVSRTLYSELFALWGTTFGAGDGSTTFGLPNGKGRDIIGRDAAQAEFDTLGEVGGAKTHTLTEAQMPVHTHPIRSADNGYVIGITQDTWTGGTSWVYTRGVSGDAVAALNTGGGGSHPILDPYVVLNWIVRAKTGSVIEILPYPRGVLGYAERVTDLALDGTTEPTVLSITLTYPANRRIRISGEGLIKSNTAGVWWLSDLKEGAAYVGRFAQHWHMHTVEEKFSGSHVFSPSAGVHTYSLTIRRAGGAASTGTLSASGLSPCFLLVEDIGAA